MEYNENKLTTVSHSCIYTFTTLPLPNKIYESVYVPTHAPITGVSHSGSYGPLHCLCFFSSALPTADYGDRVFSVNQKREDTISDDCDVG